MWWDKLFGDSIYKYPLDDDDLSHLNDLNTEMEEAISHYYEATARDRVFDAFEQARPS